MPHAAASATAQRATRSRVRLRRDELPEESLRQLEEAEQHMKGLEQEYWRSLDADEAAIEKKCATGLACLKIGMLDRAAEEYTAAAELRCRLQQ